MSTATAHSRRSGVAETRDGKGECSRKAYLVVVGDGQVNVSPQGNCCSTQMMVKVTRISDHWNPLDSKRMGKKSTLKCFQEERSPRRLKWQTRERDFFFSFALFSSAFFQLDFVFYLQSDLNESGKASTWESQDKLP